MENYRMQQLERENRNLRSELSQYDRIMGAFGGLIVGGPVGQILHDISISYPMLKLFETPDTRPIYRMLATGAVGAALGWKYYGRLKNR